MAGWPFPLAKVSSPWVLSNSRSHGSCHVWFTKGSLIRKLLSYEHLSWSAFRPVNHLTMSTTPHQVVGGCNSSESCEFRGEGGVKPCVFLVKRLLGFRGRRRRVSVSAGSGLDLQKLSTKSEQDCSESSICISSLQNVQKLSRLDHFWKMRSAKCARDCRESSVSTSKR
jgi:hypothetical protein